MEEKYLVAVIGAGPAGLFGARELANMGAHVVVFNRDIKPGGLAEYGIYPDKHTMKEGLRKQFRQVLDTPGVDYYGNVLVGMQGDLTLEDLRELGFQAILVCIGAQGTKWLGLPGEDLEGVYHAKDVVYYYNGLPPFSQRKFYFGKKVAIIGAGNVMLDIAHYMIRKVESDEVVAIVRRGPMEIKFDRKEMEYVAANLDLVAFEFELSRVTPIMQSVNQDPESAKANILSSLPKALPKVSESRFRFEFLTSPVQLFAGENNKVTSIELEDNVLVCKDGETKSRGTGNKRMMNVETIIFAIGDKVDENFGLPVKGSEFVRNPSPRFPVDGISYEIFDPETGKVIPDVFVGGWARQASNGLVGYARRDGINASKAVWQYLQKNKPVPIVCSAFESRLKIMKKPVVTKEHLVRLFLAEQVEAQNRHLEYYKYETNDAMLDAMGLR